MEESEAIKLATNHVKELGYKPSTMDVSVETYNSPWNKWLGKEHDDEYTTERKKLLEGKEYWAVYFCPKKRQFGGDVAVFIDVNTGEIITNVRGK